MPSSINFLTDSHCEETKEKEQKQIDEFNKRTAENTVMRHQLENAQRRGRTFSSDPYFKDVIVNPSGKLKSLADSCHISIEDIGTSSYKRYSSIRKEDEKTLKATEENMAESIARRRSLEYAKRRGRTFSSNPYIPEVVVNPRRELKSLANSCQLRRPGDNNSSTENNSKVEKKIEKKEEETKKENSENKEKRKGFLSRLKCFLQVNPPHSSSDSNQSKSFDNSDHINDDAR